MKYDLSWEDKIAIADEVRHAAAKQAEWNCTMERAKAMDSRELRREYMEWCKEGPYALAEWLGAEKITPQMRELWDYISDEDMGEEIAEAYLRKGGDEYKCYVEWIREEKLPYADD